MTLILGFATAAGILNDSAVSSDLTSSRLASSGLSSPHPDIITLPLTPDRITLLPH